ncbi:protein FAM177A1 isoform X2 [Dicentrarchus labrax]|uniref:protein FAM177A1 isoform X2 n=1 Tax=Dicentrarchus labrax TaxID=13489 RepID=UPI0021F51C8F|nr:protein FAM177A1 isoform X2 [Dicentrarchus labrax]
MADLSLYLTNVNVSLGQTMETDKCQSPEGATEFERVEMGDSAGRQVKVPRRTIYFASGETMEEYSTDEEEEEEEPAKKDIITVDSSKLTWGPYFWFHMWRMATSTVSVCDYMGERLASLFGITSPKYQYAIDEYYRMKKERQEQEHELSDKKYSMLNTLFSCRRRRKRRRTICRRWRSVALRSSDEVSRMILVPLQWSSQKGPELPL